MTNKIENLAAEPTSEELVKREVEAYQNILGARVDVIQLPEYVTPEIKLNLTRMGYDKIFYIPALPGLKNLAHLKLLGAKRYLEEVTEAYPNWKPPESLSESELGNHKISRNFGIDFWENVEKGRIAFPTLPGQWMAFESFDKPPEKRSHLLTPFAQKIETPIARFDKTWDKVNEAIEKTKPEILGEIGLSGMPVDIILPDALVYNLIANRLGWGKTKTYEWTKTIYRDSRPSSKCLIVGSSDIGGAAGVTWNLTSAKSPDLLFRTAVVLGS